MMKAWPLARIEKVAEPPGKPVEMILELEELFLQLILNLLLHRRDMHLEEIDANILFIGCIRARAVYGRRRWNGCCPGSCFSFFHDRHLA